MRPLLPWAPALLFAIGAVFTVGIDLQRALPLQRPLDDVVPREVQRAAGANVALSDAEVRLAGVTAYLMRSYTPMDSAGSGPFSVYVGYYESQIDGRTIHSPKNCLPGAGWEALASTRIEIPTQEGPTRVNRYLLQNQGMRALVLYWYQGRGSIESNEYVVKWNLLRDAALRRRSDEALVRIVVPVGASEASADSLGRAVAAVVISALGRALPE